jgi:hypothetical protein
MILFCGYLRLSSTYAENSDMANILLMGQDLLHGNCHGFRSGLAAYWQASSVTVDTGDRVTVRAVTGSLTPYLWMADTAWYDPAANSPDFLILQRPSASALALLLKGPR